MSYIRTDDDMGCMAIDKSDGTIRFWSHGIDTEDAIISTVENAQEFIQLIQEWIDMQKAGKK